MDAFAIARLGLGAASLAVAAVSDVRTRRVRDPLWIALGSVGMGLLAFEMTVASAPMNGWLFLASAAILFYAVFFGRPILDEDGAHFRPVRIVVLAAAVAAFLGALLVPYQVNAVGPVGGFFDGPGALVSLPIMLLVYQGFYQVGLIRGGADAKAMMALTLLVPLYPDVSPLPLLTPPANVLQAMKIFFPFSFVVFVDAAILFLAVPLAYLLVNVARREVEFPMALFGTKASLDHLPPHVWLMEHVDRRGERVAVLFPPRARDESDEIAKLRAAGAKRVWVQPKVPFMVPLLFGYFLAFVVGNLMLSLLTAVLPQA